MRKRAASRKSPSLKRMAKRLMDMPFNKDGADKSFVTAAMFAYNDYFSRVKRIGAR